MWIFSIVVVIVLVSLQRSNKVAEGRPNGGWDFDNDLTTTSDVAGTTINFSDGVATTSDTASNHKAQLVESENRTAAANGSSDGTWLDAVHKDMVVDTFGMWNGTADNNSSSGHRTYPAAPLNIVDETPAVGQLLVVARGSGEEVVDGGEQSYVAQCQMLVSYYVKREDPQNSNSWTVAMKMKNSQQEKDSDDAMEERVEQFMVRIINVDNSEKFHLLPRTDNASVVRLDQLQDGEYDFQICGVTSSFFPTVAGTEQFSWEKHAPVYKLQLLVHQAADKETGAEEEEEENGEYEYEQDNDVEE